MVIRHVTHGGPVWGLVSDHKRSQNGLAAYIALRVHFLWNAFAALVRKHAESIMGNIFYDGPTVERYTQTLQQDLNDMAETGGPVTE